MRAQSPLLIRNWSTRDVPQSQRYDYYAHALATAIFPIQLSGSAPSAFGVDMSAADLGGMTVIRQRGTPHRCFADRGNIARAEGRTFHLLTSTRSAWTLEHLTRERLGPGDVIMCDSSIPFNLEIGNDFNIVHVALSEAWIRQWLPAPSVLVGARIDANDSWGRALSAFLQSLEPARLADYPLPRSFIGDHIGSLLAFLAQSRSAVSPKAAKTEGAAVLDRIRDCMAGQSREATLCAADVAAAVSISVRSLHRHFAKSSTTFGAVLMAMRCADAVRMLESSSFSRLTVAEIGRRAGFADAAHFSRVMRARVGHTPNQLRRAHAGPSSRDDPKEE
ncbi:AraC family transcriptional regulator [Cupriavidus metallidurans]|uniref:AraC family transcriptional regulator n=1 Tax=Cupriavidus metallidurans TaxID=119219 RepID=UPI000559FA6A|nr:AraC family transcriptional regulator [Cupriavidus metallidurans]